MRLKNYGIEISSWTLNNEIGVFEMINYNFNKPIPKNESYKIYVNGKFWDILELYLEPKDLSDVRNELRNILRTPLAKYLKSPSNNTDNINAT